MQVEETADHLGRVPTRAQPVQDGPPSLGSKVQRPSNEHWEQIVAVERVSLVKPGGRFEERKNEPHVEPEDPAPGFVRPHRIHLVNEEFDGRRHRRVHDDDPMLHVNGHLEERRDGLERRLDVGAGKRLSESRGERSVLVVVCVSIVCVVCVVVVAITNVEPLEELLQLPCTRRALFLPSFLLQPLLRLTVHHHLTHIQARLERHR